MTNRTHFRRYEICTIYAPRYAHLSFFQRREYDFRINFTYWCFLIDSFWNFKVDLFSFFQKGNVEPGCQLVEIGKSVIGLHSFYRLLLFCLSHREAILLRGRGLFWFRLSLDLIMPKHLQNIYTKPHKTFFSCQRFLSPITTHVHIC